MRTAIYHPPTNHANAGLSDSYSSDDTPIDRSPLEVDVQPVLPPSEPVEPIRQASPWRPGSTGELNGRTSYRPVMPREALTMSVGYSRPSIIR